MLAAGPVFNNCSHDVITPDQYHAKISMMARLAKKLNAAGIWPIYSTFNGFSTTPYRNCPFPYDEYYKALAEVGWFRFYEIGIGPRVVSGPAHAQSIRVRSLARRPHIKPPCTRKRATDRSTRRNVQYTRHARRTCIAPNKNVSAKLLHAIICPLASYCLLSFVPLAVFICVV